MEEWVESTFSLPAACIHRVCVRQRGRCCLSSNTRGIIRINWILTLSLGDKYLVLISKTFGTKKLARQTQWCCILNKQANIDKWLIGQETMKASFICFRGNEIWHNFNSPTVYEFFLIRVLSALVKEQSLRQWAHGRWQTCFLALPSNLTDLIWCVETSQVLAWGAAYTGDAVVQIAASWHEAQHTARFPGLLKFTKTPTGCH